jgi:hypothetical protein
MAGGSLALGWRVDHPFSAEQAIGAFAAIPSDDTFTQQLTEDYILYLYWNGLEGTMQDFTGNPVITGGDAGGGFNGPCGMMPSGMGYDFMGNSLFIGYVSYYLICRM